MSNIRTYSRPLSPVEVITYQPSPSAVGQWSGQVAAGPRYRMVNARNTRVGAAGPGTGPGTGGPIQRTIYPVVAAGSNIEEAVVVADSSYVGPLLVEDETDRHPGSRSPGDLAITSVVLRSEVEGIKMAQTPANMELLNGIAVKQKILEERYFSEGQICPINRMKQLRDRLGTMNSDEFKRILREKFYDPEVMLAASCVTGSVTYRPPIDTGDVKSNIRVKRWLRDLRRIGAESVEGVALEADFGKSDDTFIIKAPRDPKNPTLLHEYFVGVYGLNQVRAIVPNFAYIMGGFKCSLPVVDDEKRVVAWCNDNDNPIDYVIYENVTPGKTLSDVIKDSDFETWLNYYLQIIYALHIAHKMADYTHYDLHTDNVIIREVPQGRGGKKFAIKYETERGHEYIVTDRVATVIDYGLSHIMYDGRHYGVGDRLPWGVRPDYSFPMHDAYKLLMMSMRDMKYHNRPEMVKQAESILRFFNATEPVNDVIAKQEKTYYFLPFNEKTMSYGFFDLTAHIRNVMPEHCRFIVTQPVVKVLGCNGDDICIDTETFLREVGLEIAPQAETVFDFYDLVSRKSVTSPSEVERIKRDFEVVWPHARRAAIREYNEHMSKLNILLRGGTIDDRTVDKFKILRLYTSKDTSVDIFFSPNVLNSYKNYIFRVSEMYDTMQTANVLSEALIYTAQMFGDEKLAERVEKSYTQIKLSVTPTWEVVVQYLNQDINHTRMLMGDSKLNKIINDRLASSKQFRWWWKVLPEITQVIAKPLP